MSKQRLIFYSDARHTHIYAYDPPIRVEDAVAPIDDVAGTGVDTFVYGFGAGLTMYHNTKVGETWAEHLIKAGKPPSANRTFGTPSHSGGHTRTSRASETGASISWSFSPTVPTRRACRCGGAFAPTTARTPPT